MRGSRETVQLDQPAGFRGAGIRDGVVRAELCESTPAPLPRESPGSSPGDFHTHTCCHRHMRAADRGGLFVRLHLIFRAEGFRASHTQQGKARTPCASDSSPGRGRSRDSASSPCCAISLGLEEVASWEPPSRATLEGRSHGSPSRQVDDIEYRRACVFDFLCRRG
jgi:hypothetical protein